MIKMKTCTNCRQEKPATAEYFNRQRRGKDGLAYHCKDCTRAYNKQYALDNSEKEKERYKKYNAENKEKRNDYAKKYYEQNLKDDIQFKNERKEYTNQYYANNKNKWNTYQEGRVEYMKQWRIENKKHLLAYDKQWRLNNEERFKMLHKKAWHKRESLKKQLPATLTIAQWMCIKEIFEYKCAYCGMTEKKHLEVFDEKLHQEHFIPISKDGEYTHNNIIPACKSCNCSKRNKDFYNWYPKQSFYSEDRKDKILNHFDYIDENIQQLEVI